MKGGEYRDRIAGYVLTNFGKYGLVVYTEVPLGTTIIGKRRHVDVFVRSEKENLALGIECKYQAGSGTTDEKIPYALEDLEAMWIPGCLAYAGEGWSKGVLHTLEGSRNAVRCFPEQDLARTKDTRELDDVIASVFGLWGEVISPERRFSLDAQLELPAAPLKKAAAKKKRRSQKRTG